MLFASALTGEGLESLQLSLQCLLVAADSPVEQPYFTLPIDRAFTITGHGTVGTGTLRRGYLRVGQTVEIWPRGERAEVRGLEVHGQPVSVALPGWRTAVNLRGVKKEDLAHGDLLATPGALRLTQLLDAELTLLRSAEKPVKRGQAVVLHSGTSEIAARVYPLGQPEIGPGETCWVQFRLSEEAAIPADESYIIRTPSPVETLGGGRIIDPYPLKHTQVDDKTLHSLQTLASGEAAARVEVKLREAGAAGRDARQLALDLGLPPETVLASSAVVFCGNDLVLHPDAFETLGGQLVAAVQEFHATHPMRRGMPLEEARRRLPLGLKANAFHRLLDALAENGALESYHGLVRQTGYDPSAAFSDVEREIAREIEGLFRDGGLKPPDLESVLKRDRRRKMLYHFLLEDGIIVPTTERTSNRTVVFHRDAIAKGERLLSEALGGRHRTDGIGLEYCSWHHTKVFDSAAGILGQPRRDETAPATCDTGMEGGEDAMTDRTLRLTEMVSCAG